MRAAARAMATATASAAQRSASTNASTSTSSSASASTTSASASTSASTNASASASTNASASASASISASAVEVSVAPMMAYTDRTYRSLARIISKRTVLYTEMVVDQTIVHQEKNLERFYGHDKDEHPLILQLGGNSVDAMRRSAELAEQWGFDEINLNVGCPSKKVSSCQFGARLMLDAQLVRSLVTAMQSVVSIPVTVKCRLGVDDHDDYEFAKAFVAAIPECDHFIIHARKCMLNGLGTKENRSVPPLMYDRVFRLCKDFPDKKFTLNGGLTSVEQIKAIVEEHPYLHGVMIGRAAYANPCLLANIDYHIKGDKSAAALTRRKVFADYAVYCKERAAEGVEAYKLFKPLAALVAGEVGAKGFRVTLNQSSLPKAQRSKDLEAVLQKAIAMLSDETLDRPIVENQQPLSLAVTEVPLAAAANKRKDVEDLQSAHPDQASEPKKIKLPPLPPCDSCPPPPRPNSPSPSPSPSS